MYILNIMSIEQLEDFADQAHCEYLINDGKVVDFIIDEDVEISKELREFIRR